MRRDVGRFAGRTFDILVIGGGVYGLTIACDAAQRGLSVALIDRDDFGSGSSFNHLRTIHGGLRYLQTMNLSRARESIRERRALARIAPHTIGVLPFVLPLSRSLLKGAWAMRAAFLLDQTIGADRNEGVAPRLSLPPGRVVSGGEAEELVRGLGPGGATCAAVWHDYVAEEADRLTFTWAAAAAEQGAALANYVEAKALLRDGQRIVGVKASDVQTAADIEISARLTVNATGAAIDRILAPLGIATGLPLLKAMNLVTRLDGGDKARGARSGAGRHLFQVPWRGRALFGTWESGSLARPGDTSAVESEVAMFLSEINSAFPSAHVEPDDVTLVHRGVVPAISTSHGAVSLEGRERICDHASQGFEGILSIAGTKYTTARAVAERVVDEAFRKLQRRPEPCRTDSTPLPGADRSGGDAAIAEARREWSARLPDETIRHLVASYGSRYRDVLAVANQNPEWLARLDDTSPVIGAQVVWAAREEMALTLRDAVIRRTPLGALGRPSPAGMERAAHLLGAELGWSEETTAGEVAHLREFYAIQGSDRRL